MIFLEDWSETVKYLKHSLQRQKDLWTSFQIWESRFSEVLSILGSWGNKAQELHRRNLLCSNTNLNEMYQRLDRILGRRKLVNSFILNCFFLNLNPWTISDVGNMFCLVCYCTAFCCTMLLINYNPLLILQSQFRQCQTCNHTKPQG